jgi:hypothetical protein
MAHIPAGQSQRPLNPSQGKKRKADELELTSEDDQRITKLARKEGRPEEKKQDVADDLFKKSDQPLPHTNSLPPVEGMAPQAVDPSQIKITTVISDDGAGVGSPSLQTAARAETPPSPALSTASNVSSVPSSLDSGSDTEEAFRLETPAPSPEPPAAQAVHQDPVAPPQGAPQSQPEQMPANAFVDISTPELNTLLSQLSQTINKLGKQDDASDAETLKILRQEFAQVKEVLETRKAASVKASPKVDHQQPISPKNELKKTFTWPQVKAGMKTFGLSLLDGGSGTTCLLVDAAKGLEAAHIGSPLQRWIGTHAEGVKLAYRICGGAMVLSAALTAAFPPAAVATVPLILILGVGRMAFTAYLGMSLRSSLNQHVNSMTFESPSKANYIKAAASVRNLTAVGVLSNIAFMLPGAGAAVGGAVTAGSVSLVNPILNTSLTAVTSVNPSILYSAASGADGLSSGYMRAQARIDKK